MLDPSRRTLRPAVFPVRLLADPSHAKTLNSALWLYLVLRAAASPSTGRLQASHEELGRVLDVGAETIASLLGRLKAHGYVETRRVHGQVEVRICDWAPPLPPRWPPPEPEPEPEPSGAQALALEVAEALGDMSNLARYEDLVETYPEAAVRRAFREARLMPQAQVRRSRGALFTYLLKQYGNETDLSEHDE